MNYHEVFAHLLGTPYVDGTDDCYGLCRRYYADCYGIELPNYARSADFFADGIDLIGPFLLEEGFAVVDVPLDKLQVGDGLLISVRRRWMAEQGVVNHVGVYVGNHTFLHHMYERPSCEEALTTQWKQRITAVLRHPDVTDKNAVDLSRNPTDILSLLPDHVKQRYGI